MIIYNVTTKVTHQIEKDWVNWIKQEHIPDIVATGCFTHAHILRLIEVDDSEGPTFAVQYHSPGKELYNRYIQEFAEAMRKKAFDKWGDQFISFRSVLEVVN